MAKIPFDLAPASAGEKLRGRAAKPRKPVPPDEQPDLGSFEARVAGTSRDLVTMVEEGVPPLDFLPASDGMLIRGKRHLIAAPRKTGKSIGMESHLVDMALAGARVSILDRENGAQVYAARLADIFEARQLKKAPREKVRAGVRYYEFPRLRKTDAAALQNQFEGCDLVVFDSQRMFLSDLGLDESDSDDYARFMHWAVEPLFRAGIATLILDNTGHGDKSRSRGSSAKGDLNEVLFSLDAPVPFDLHTTGRLSLRIVDTRFGARGEWSMVIGGGKYEPWVSGTAREDRSDFREAVIKALSDKPGIGQDKLIEAARAAGVAISSRLARPLLSEYVADPDVPIEKAPGERGGYVLREGTNAPA